jgi:hypothetical protein
VTDAKVTTAGRTILLFEHAHEGCRQVIEVTKGAQ